MEFLPKEIMQIAKDSKLDPEKKRKEIIKRFSEVIKLIGVEVIREGLSYPESKLIKGLSSRYIQEKLEELEIIKSTKKGYVITERAKVLWNTYLKELIESVINVRGEEATAVFNSSLSFETLLILTSGPKTFNELRKDLDLHEGSLSKVLNKYLGNLVVLEFRNNKKYYRINPVVEPAVKRLALLIDNLVEGRWDLLYTSLSQLKPTIAITSVLPIRESVEKDLELFREKHKVEDYFHRYEDLIHDHIIITYSYISEAETSEVIQAIIKEQSGFLDDSKYLKPILTLEKGKVCIGYDTKYITSLQQILNLLALFDNPVFNMLMIDDIEFPHVFLRKFKGPRLGREKIREILGVEDRPILQATFLPVEYLDIHRFTNLSRRLFRAGVDEISDHRTMIEGLDLFKERVQVISGLLDEIKSETGEQKIYYFHVYGEDYEERLDELKSAENKGIGIALAPLSFGIPSTFRVLKSIEKEDRFPVLFGLLLQVPFTKYARKFLTEKGEILSGFGISMKVLIKFFVLLGGDEIVVDPPLYPFSDREEIKIQCKILDGYFKGFKKPFPVFLGGIRPFNIPMLISEYGKDIVLNFTTWSLRIAERRGFSIERSISAFRQAIEIGTMGEQRLKIDEERFKDFLDHFEFYKNT
jgi:ribulose 1,5-bisphosphate carboxylase large subunit-like protein/DNA-binding HxlR family transcriptional regulator